MSITISPTVAAINAATKPYTVTLSATTDFEPRYTTWYIDSVENYKTSQSTGTGPTWAVQGPTIIVRDEGVVIRLVIRNTSDVDSETTITTATYHATPTAEITLLSQDNGVLITDGTTVPMTPTAYGITGAEQITLGWSAGANGCSPSCSISVNVDIEDDEDFVSTYDINWGDGNTDTYQGYSRGKVYEDQTHTYSTTGNMSVVLSVTDMDSAVSVTDTLAVVVPVSATGYRAGQYKITQYKNQVGFQQVNIVGWRAIEDASTLITLYETRQGYDYYFQLQLREMDFTGRPSRTSALSATAHVGPWS